MCKTFECEQIIYKEDLCLSHYGANLICDIVEFELTQRKLISEEKSTENLKLIEKFSKDYLKRHNYFWNEYITEQTRRGYFNNIYVNEC